MLTQEKNGGGVIIPRPSSTQVLQPYQNWSFIPEQVLAAAALRGTFVHDVASAIVKGLMIPKIPPEYLGYINSFRSWLESAVQEVIFSEQEFYCPCFHYVGHPDLGVVMRGDLGITIPDLKTPATQTKAWRAQLASYWHLVAEHGGLDLPIIRSGSLMLNGEGKQATLIEYTKFQTRDFNAFVSALNAWRWFNE